MKKLAPQGLITAVGVLAFGIFAASLATAELLISKPPDLGPSWQPIGNSGTYVYANCFVAPAGPDNMVTTLGTWLEPLNPGPHSTVRLEIWGTAGGGGPDCANVIAATGPFSTEAAGLNLHTRNVVSGGGPLTAGVTYWFAVTAAGFPAGPAPYRVGGHTPGPDGCRFWFSNDPTGCAFDGTNLSPEMAFQVLLTSGDCQVFFDKQEFDVFNEQHGKFLKGVEDFEESNVPPNQIIGIPNPLRGNVPNVNGQGLGFPNGLRQKNIVIQDNITPGCNPPNPNPGNTGNDIAVFGAGAGGSNSKKVSANFFASSLDLLFPDPNENHTGVGFLLGDNQNFPQSPWHITVYDKADAVIAKVELLLPPQEPNKGFFGIWCVQTIGRINICGPNNTLEIVDDIQMWEERTTCQAFFDKQEFDIFNEQHGKFLKGIEDFEESNIAPNDVRVLPNPLQGNVPNVDPGGIGFPNGLRQKNIVIQDNVTPGCNPQNPNPGAGNDRLAVLGQGFGGANSKKVSSNFFVASTDLIFPDPQDNLTGVGFELGALQGFPVSPWFITVFNKAGTEIGRFVVPAPPNPEPGKTFFGIWCDDGIGRINICDNGSDGEVIDNIQMWTEPPLCQAFFDKLEFETFNEGHGKFLKGVENFEESNIGPGQVAGIRNPLEGNVPNVDPSGIGFPTGLEQKSIVIQDNVTVGCNPPSPNPGNTGGDIAVIGPGFGNANSKKVSANYFAASTDLIFPNPAHSHTGVGFELGALSGFPASPWHITVYDQSGAEIGQFDVPLPPGPEPGKTFFGVWCEEIGRINICDDGTDGEVVDNIQIWEDITTGIEPAPAGPIQTSILLSGPNPFNPATAWKLDLATAGHADLRIYDADGRLVRNVMREHLEAGVHTLHWDGRNDSGQVVGSGVYFWRFDGAGVRRSSKFVVLK
jgi:hypothetical protein